jgi:hypothetical protein
MRTPKMIVPTCSSLGEDISKVDHFYEVDLDKKACALIMAPARKSESSKRKRHKSRDRVIYQI